MSIHAINECVEHEGCRELQSVSCRQSNSMRHHMAHSRYFLSREKGYRLHGVPAIFQWTTRRLLSSRTFQIFSSGKLILWTKTNTIRIFLSLPIAMQRRVGKYEELLVSAWLDLGWNASYEKFPQNFYSKEIYRGSRLGNLNCILGSRTEEMIHRRSVQILAHRFQALDFAWKWGHWSDFIHEIANRMYHDCRCGQLDG